MIAKGFSLIELMVVVAIIGIISAIAFPSYQGYMNDTYRGQAVADMKVCALALDRYYSNDFDYKNAGTGESSEVCNRASPTDGVQKYTISVTISSTYNDYTILATPIAGSCDPECIQLTADGTQTTL